MAPPWSSVFSSASSVHFLHCSVLPLHLCLLLCCLSLNAAMPQGQDSILEISALSRPLELGMLYNACNDRLVPGVGLWDPEDIEKATAVSPQPNTRFQVSGSDSLKQKMKLLDVSASVKISFMGGLCGGGGSASYLSEKSSSTHQSSMTLKYHVTTEFKELMITQLKTPNLEVYDKTDATHVVVGVLYGGDAIMEFQDTFSNETQRRLVEGNLNLMINKIPGISISGQGDLEMDKTEKEKVKNFVCRFYGDARLEKLPSTYEEAVKVYKELPSLLGSDGENVVPLRVWLYPLSKLSNTALKLKRMISATLVSAIEKVMDDLHHAEIKSNDLLEKSNEIKAEDIGTKLEWFQSRLRVFSVEFLRKLGELIPAIRGGNMEETALRDLMNSQDASGFSGHEMEWWLDEKEAEINVVTNYLEKVRSYPVMSPGAELVSFLMEPDVKDAFVLSFTSLNDEEPYLNKISQAGLLQNGSTISTPKRNQNEKVPWYRRLDIKEAMDSALSSIQKMPRGNKVISFSPDPKHPILSLQWYHNAALKDPQLTYAHDLTLDPKTAHKRLQLSSGNRNVSHASKDQYYPYSSDKFKYSYQVLSREPLIGQSYWEWEWSGYYVAVGVAYRNMSRSKWIGGTDQAWCLSCHNYRHISYFYAYHNYAYTRVPPPLSNSRRVGVYVDRKGGSLSFYSVRYNTLTHMHTFNNITFTDEPLHAAVKISSSSSVTLF